MIKIDLHTHTSDDPADRIPHSAAELIERASALGYGALAITLHNRWWDPAPLTDFAAARGLVLLPAVERSVSGRHVLLINVGRDAERVRTFEDLAAFKASSPGLVVAPHPFYPVGSSLGRALLDRHAGIFDAVEISALHVRGLSFNRRAAVWAREHGKPLVGNADLHRLDQLDCTYSLVDATPDADDICRAVRAGRVEVRTRPLRWGEAAWIAARMIAAGARRSRRR